MEPPPSRRSHPRLNHHSVSPLSSAYPLPATATLDAEAGGTFDSAAISTHDHYTLTSSHSLASLTPSLSRNQSRHGLAGVSSSIAAGASTTLTSTAHHGAFTSRDPYTFDATAIFSAPRHASYLAPTKSLPSTPQALLSRTNSGLEVNIDWDVRINVHALSSAVQEKAMPGRKSRSYAALSSISSTRARARSRSKADLLARASVPADADAVARPRMHRRARTGYDDEYNAVSGQGDAAETANWLVRTASALSLGAAEAKGQTWLAARASTTSLTSVAESTSLPAVNQDSDLPYEDEGDGVRLPRPSSQRRLGGLSQPGSARSSRRPSAVRLAMTPLTTTATSHAPVAVPGRPLGDRNAYFENMTPDWVDEEAEASQPQSAYQTSAIGLHKTDLNASLIEHDEDDDDDAEEAEAAWEQDLHEEGQLRHLVRDRVGGWVDWAMGWVDWRGEAQWEEVEQDDPDDPESPGYRQDGDGDADGIVDGDEGTVNTATADEPLLGAGSRAVGDRPRTRLRAQGMRDKTAEYQAWTQRQAQRATHGNQADEMTKDGEERTSGEMLTMPPPPGDGQGVGADARWLWGVARRAWT